MQLAGQVAVITGGSRGIGREIALLFASHGCDVAVSYRNDSSAAEKTADAIKSLGRRVLLLQGDISDPEQVSRSMQNVMDTFGRIDILVNNAGITQDNLLVSMDYAEMETVIKINLLGAMYWTRQAAKHMMMEKKGKIINMSSVAASKPGKGQSNYAAAKGGIEAFTMAMAVELASKNILVNAVAPGVVRTDMSKRIRKFGEDEIISRLLIKRYAEPNEVAHAVLFLAGPHGNYITGEVIHINGGLKMA